MISTASYSIPKCTRRPSSAYDPISNNRPREPSSPTSDSTSNVSVGSSSHDIKQNHDPQQESVKSFQHAPCPQTSLLPATNQQDGATDTRAGEILPLVNIASPTTDDILCGRGKGPQNHPGNVFFREKIVAPKRLRYATTFGMSEKRAIIGLIIKEVRARGSRFLQLDAKSGLWSDIGDRRAHLKTAQALRECTQYKRKLDEIVVNARRCKNQNMTAVDGATMSDDANLADMLPNSQTMNQAEPRTSMLSSSSSLLSSSTTSLYRSESQDSEDGAGVKVDSCPSPVGGRQQADVGIGIRRSRPLEEAPVSPPSKRTKSATVPSLQLPEVTATTMMSDAVMKMEVENHNDNCQSFIEASELFDSNALTTPPVGHFKSNDIAEEETTITSGEMGSSATVLGMPWVQQKAASFLDPTSSPRSTPPMSATADDKPSHILRKVSSDNSSANTPVGLDHDVLVRQMQAGPPTDIIVFLNDCINADEGDFVLDELTKETEMEKEKAVTRVVSEGNDDVSVMSSFSHDHSGALKLNDVANDLLSGSTFPTLCPDDRAKILSFSPFEDDVDCDNELEQLETAGDTLPCILPLDAC